MMIQFSPHYRVTSAITQALIRVERAKERVAHLPLTPQVLASLRETSRLQTTHYSTMIEGNHLTVEQIEAVVKHKGHFPGREREEHEVQGYYAALEQVEQWVREKKIITQETVQLLHALVLSSGSKKIKPTAYRDGQNVIYDGKTRRIVYMPPEAHDVEGLMHGLVNWINEHANTLACPLVAAIAHYQFATIHPYYDGNGRTARLLTTLILHLGGYDLKGLYSLEEYYARNLPAYYEAISVGESHNYYMGRAEADITGWITYFIEGMAVSFENVISHMHKAYDSGVADHSQILKKLDPRQRKVLVLFKEYAVVTAQQIGGIFGLKERASALLCKKWVQEGFLEIVDLSKKGRKYRLAQQYVQIIG